MNSTLKKHFSVLKKIVRDSLVNEEKDKFAGRLEGLFNKGQSNQIHVAVVGEFNSGKSTFVNALLRERILKEAGRPTTAAATHITRSKPHNLLQFLFGTKSYVTVDFDDGHSFVFHKGNYSRCSAYIQQTYNIQTLSLYDVIQVITTVQEVAKHVIHLHLEQKTKSIPKNMVIIDTPGFNPGEMNFDNHLQITGDIVSNVADMALILMPSTQPMSATLVNFLKTNIHRYIHRCIFLVTKVDLIPADERELVYEYVRKHVRQLGVHSPCVYGISARTMLPVKKIPDSMRDVWPLYQKDFCRVEKDCWANLVKYKEIAIREHVYHLLNELSNEIKDTIDNHNRKLQHTLQILKDSPIKRIEELIDKLYKDACCMLDRFYDRVELSAGSHMNSAQGICYSIIKEGGKLKNYRKKEGPQINLVITDEDNQYISLIKGNIIKSVALITDIITQFRQEFHVHYENMSSLEPEVDYVPNLLTIHSSSIDLSVSRSLKNKTWVGRWFMNISNHFRSVDTVQNEVITEVSNAIDLHFSQLESNTRMAVEEIKEIQKQCLKDYFDKHIQQYGKQVDTLIQQQTLEKKQLEKNIFINYGYIDQISELQESIQSEILLLLEQ